MVGGIADDSLRHGFLRMEVFLGGWQAVAVFDLFLAMIFSKFHAKRKVGKRPFSVCFLPSPLTGVSFIGGELRMMARIEKKVGTPSKNIEMC